MRKTKNSAAQRVSQRRFRSSTASPEKAPFIVHIRELRKRLFYVAIAVGGGAALAYAVQAQLTTWLLQPAGNQQFIYTTPGGGFDFQFKLCVYAGLALGIPVIVYQLGRYLQPLIRQESTRFIRSLMLSSCLLAFVGISFGYFVGLPAAMHFLLQSFSSERISALITIQSYMSFVVAYLLGSALLFQLPLIMILINRLKPLQPRKLFFHQQWFLLGAFVAGAMVSPTPDIRNQLVLTGPIILTYELSIVLIWFIQKRQRRPRKVIQLLQQDEVAQSERLASFKKARIEWRKSMQAKTSPIVPAPAVKPVAAAALQGTAKSVVPGAVHKPPATSPKHTPQNTTRPFVAIQTSTIVHPRNYIQDFRRRPSLVSRPTQANQI